MVGGIADGVDHESHAHEHTSHPHVVQDNWSGAIQLATVVCRCLARKNQQMVAKGVGK